VIIGANAPLPVDIAVTWSFKKHNVNRAMAERGGDVLILEHGYFGDRINKFCSCGFNGLNGNAEFIFPIIKPSDRWEKHAVEVKPWRKTPGEYVLLLGQVSGDASMVRFPPNWYSRIASEAKSVFGLPVKFRPHPLARPTPSDQSLEAIGGSLQDAFKNAHCAITWNSNSGVDAVLAGVPTFTFDEGSMAWPVSGHRLKADLVMPERDIWLYHLAYCQWTVEELASGEAWEFLRTKYENKTRHAASV
jgi:hypothetical protein